jgi:hypothetical protein
MEPEAGARRKRMTRGVEKGFAHPKQTLGANTGDIQWDGTPSHSEGASIRRGSRLTNVACNGMSGVWASRGGPLGRKIQ